MRNEQEISIDALLRDIARQQNAALPLDDWKREILIKAQADKMPGAQPPAFDEFTALRRRKNIRRITLGVATAAAALLILLGTRSLWQGGIGMKNAASASEAPVEDWQMYAMEAPTEEATEAPMSIMSLPEESTQAPAAPEPAAPAPAERPAADSAGGAASGTDSGANERNIRGVFTEEETQALSAVLAATAPGNGDRAVYDGVFTQITRAEMASLTVQPLDGGAQQTIQRELLYRVVLDTRVENAPIYAVDAATFEVLGKIVE